MIIAVDDDDDDTIFIPYTNRTYNQKKSQLFYFKRQLKTALPLIGINLANTLEGFFMGMILGKITPDALAAGSLIGSSNLILSSALMSPLCASTILIRESFGGNRRQDISLLWRQSLVIGSMLSAIRIILMKWALKPTLNLLIARSEIVDLVGQYYDNYIFGVMLDAWAQTFENFYLGIDKLSLVILVRYLKLFTFTLSAYLLSQSTINGNTLGIAGIGLAYGVQALIGLSIYTIMTFCKTEIAEYNLFKILMVRKIDHLKHLWAIGWPIGLSSLNGMSSEFIITMMTAKFDDPALTAREISGIYNSLLFQPTDAISLSTSLLVSESHGEKQINAIARFGNTGVILGLLSALLGLGLFGAIPTRLTRLFIQTNDNDSQGLFDLMKYILLIVALSQLAESTATICYRALAGLEDTLIPTILSTSSTWLVGIPMAYFLSTKADLGLEGLLIGQGIGMTLASIVLFHRWKTKSQLLATQQPVAVGNDTQRVPLLANNLRFFSSPKSLPIVNSGVDVMPERLFTQN